MAGLLRACPSELQRRPRPHAANGSRNSATPRTAGVDPIDWIERIPIEETRRYVAKVLSNIQIYRARLGDEATALQLDEDLNRARAASKATQQGATVRKTSTANSHE